jgi:hypothetical protein
VPHKVLAAHLQEHAAGELANENAQLKAQLVALEAELTRRS